MLWILIACFFIIRISVATMMSISNMFPAVNGLIHVDLVIKNIEFSICCMLFAITIYQHLIVGRHFYSQAHLNCTIYLPVLCSTNIYYSQSIFGMAWVLIIFAQLIPTNNAIKQCYVCKHSYMNIANRLKVSCQKYDLTKPCASRVSDFILWVMFHDKVLIGDVKLGMYKVNHST